jgi:hypothetical protein
MYTDRDDAAVRQDTSQGCVLYISVLRIRVLFFGSRIICRVHIRELQYLPMTPIQTVNMYTTAAEKEALFKDFIVRAYVFYERSTHTLLSNSAYLRDFGKWRTGTYDSDTSVKLSLLTRFWKMAHRDVQRHIS